MLQEPVSMLVPCHILRLLGHKPVYLPPDELLILVLAIAVAEQGLEEAQPAQPAALAQPPVEEQTNVPSPALLAAAAAPLPAAAAAAAVPATQNFPQERSAEQQLAVPVPEQPPEQVSGPLKLPSLCTHPPRSWTSACLCR